MDKIKGQDCNSINSNKNFTFTRFSIVKLIQRVSVFFRFKLTEHLSMYLSIYLLFTYLVTFTLEVYSYIVIPLYTVHIYFHNKISGSSTTSGSLITLKSFVRLFIVEEEALFLREFVRIFLQPPTKNPSLTSISLVPTLLFFVFSGQIRYPCSRDPLIREAVAYHGAQILEINFSLSGKWARVKLKRPHLFAYIFYAFWVVQEYVD